MWSVSNMQFRKSKVLFVRPKKEKQKSTKKQIMKANKASISSDCTHSFGYLANRPENTPIPQECLFCLRVTGCISNIIKN